MIRNLGAVTVETKGHRGDNESGGLPGGPV
jgi:hypothetical protein